MSERPGIVPVIAPSGWHVWGNERAVADLQRAAAHGPRHAYILTGPDAVGKRTIALEFARALVCERPPAPGIPCGQCSRCRRVARGVHPDVTAVDLATQAAAEKASSASRNTSLNVGTVREISANVALRPVEANWRVVIVDDVETMQETAQEAFLKTLEEPPAYTVILLLTSDVDLLLPTILSRCVTIPMQVVPTRTIREALITAGVEPDKAEIIADLSDGRIGWTFAAANDPTLVEKQEALHTDARRWVHASDYDRLIRATTMADRFSKDREVVFGELLAVQLEWRRALIDSVQATPDGSKASPRGLVTAVRSVERCIVDLEANVRPRLAMQSMVLQWPPLS
ncbi:MAG: DNA polymerase III subunit [Thermomicrobiales bacterium]